MKIKDILNRDLVNLTNCESEPIHIPGSIQPHGFLLALRTREHIIEFCSANCGEFLGYTPQQVLGKPIREIFPADQANRFGLYVENGSFDHSQPFVFEIGETPYNTTVHRSGESLILEFEPFPDGELSLPNLYNQTRKFVAFMEGSRTLLDLCKSIADEMRMITGYDRVMIYRFDKDYNGEVIAESKRADLESFSGQKYPHTDIPAQARELYIRNQLRLIADINYTPVPLLTLDSGETRDNSSLDLSLSILRSVSPIHIEYLQNMGVGATMTVSLLKDQKLWGLIACHHYSRKVLPHYTRLAALLQGHFLTSQISVREVAEEFEIAQTVEKKLRNILDGFREGESFMDIMFDSPLLPEIANATGTIVIYNGRIYKNGLVPPDKDIRTLTSWLLQYSPHEPVVTTHLAEIYPEGEALSAFCAGLIFHPMPTGDCVLWFRPELIQTINWAGNPEKAIVVSDDGFRLSPRKSFELWMEVVKNKSQEWRKSEIGATASFAYAFQKHINLHLVRTQEEKHRVLNEELQSANKELANINWISTHDLKEPLRKIQIFASKVLDPENTDVSKLVRDSVGRMKFAAEKMQQLIEDIMAYSRTGTIEKVYEPTDLNDILEMVLQELQDEIKESGAEIAIERLPHVQAIPFQIRQLFNNLLTNAIKFVQPDQRPQINITVSEARGADYSDKKLSAGLLYHKITFADNGIGFEEEYYERIFDVFQRLHPAHKYPGTGIGLAICMKIAENHHGTIVASSAPGKGSSFSILLPKSE